MYQPSNLFPVHYMWCDPGKVYLYLGTVLHVSCSIYISIHVPLYYLPVPKCANVHAFRGQMLQRNKQEELMADPGSKTDVQNDHMKEVAPEQQQTHSRDWRTAYCRLKGEGDDDISGEEERERDWCWQVGIFDF